LGDGIGMTQKPEIRELRPDELPELASLLAANFPRFDVDFWHAAMNRLARRERVEGMPLLGLGIVDQGLQGAVLMISSKRTATGGPQIITNISTWCVNPSHRGALAKELYAQATSADQATYSNLSAAANTIKTITRLGFSEWRAGQAIGIGTGTSGTARVLPFADAIRETADPAQLALMEDHHRLGCVVLGLALKERVTPLIFLKRKVLKHLPCAQLIYCEDFSDFSANSLAINNHLLRHGLPTLLVDASGKVPGLTGRYFPGKAAKYYKGPLPLADIDHCYSEMMYIGF
jgi:hypothetical protein